MKGSVVSRGESLTAALERRLIEELVRAVATADDDVARRGHLAALADLVRHADPSLDPARFERWTRAFLEHAGLWAWPRSALAWKLPGDDARR